MKFLATTTLMTISASIPCSISFVQKTTETLQVNTNRIIITTINSVITMPTTPSSTRPKPTPTSQAEPPPIYSLYPVEERTPTLTPKKRPKDPKPIPIYSHPLRNWVRISKTPTCKAWSMMGPPNTKIVWIFATTKWIWNMATSTLETYVFDFFWPFLSKLL